MTGAKGRTGWVVARISVGGISMVRGETPDVSTAGDVFADPDRMLRASEVAALLGIRPGTFRAYVARSQAPAPDDPDLDRPAERRQPRWRLQSIQEWQDQRLGRGGPGRPGKRARD